MANSTEQNQQEMKKKRGKRGQGRRNEPRVHTDAAGLGNSGTPAPRTMHRTLSSSHLGRSGASRLLLFLGLRAFVRQHLLSNRPQTRRCIIRTQKRARDRSHNRPFCFSSRYC
ncbi:hypothetical protein GWI33_023189 [Rhynchophorus ferrugineus]|uniref:Uncharacterized protein n=1 Tax=Rhynchophorus ferrugineus TaxID=354439 RepID=A0A834MHF6_RHYFE|nr:hypothetical protein GWI33_023189 [Rhynchophorus ferrugineus]